MTSREREAVGWLDADNITPITKAGEYTLPPTKDKRQDRTWQKEDEAEAKKESGDYQEVPDMVNREMEDNRDE